MEILIVPVPLLSATMAVNAYLLNYQKGNDYLGFLNAASFLDGGGTSPALETINAAGIEAFTIEQPVFVPVSSIMLLSDLGAQCAHPPGRVTFVFERDLRPEEPFLSHLRTLRNQGFRLAFRAVKPEHYPLLMPMADYLIINVKKYTDSELTLRLRALQAYRHLTLIAAGVDRPEVFERLKKQGRFSLFEGAFYRIPVNKGQRDINPFQANLVHLLNIVRDPNFEFEAVSEIVQRDTALSLSLLRLINSPYIGLTQRVKTISHAVTLLGQKEVRKWVTTSVARLLGADKPNELTKLSLIRAKFCDNLAPLFGLEKERQAIFMMGLFSVLDVILDLPMDQVFQRVLVSEEIRDALTGAKGPYYPLFDFMSRYESADWTGVSQQVILHDLTVSQIYDAYIEAASWYSDLILSEIYPEEQTAQ